MLYFADILMPPVAPRVMKKANSGSGRSPWMIIVVALFVGLSVFYFMNRGPSDEESNEISKTVTGISVKVFTVCYDGTLCLLTFMITS